MWTFKRCQINGTVYHSERYKRATARNNFTVSFSGKKQSEYGFVLNYVTVQEKCHQASCMNANCNCQVECSYFALLRILDKHLNHLPSLKGTVVVGHILKVEGTTKIVAIPLRCIERKCMLVSTSNGIFVCHLANRIERDWLFEDNFNCETCVLQCSLKIWEQRNLRYKFQCSYDWCQNKTIVSWTQVDFILTQ